MVCTVCLLMTYCSYVEWVKFNTPCKLYSQSDKREEGEILNEQDGPTSCMLGIAHFVPEKAKFFGVIFWPYNKSFIDQACSVKMAQIMKLLNYKQKCNVNSLVNSLL